LKKTEKILAALRDDQAAEGPLPRLASLVVEEDLATPLGDLVEAGFAASLVRKGLRAWLRSDLAEGWLLERIRTLRGWLSEQEGALGDLIPHDLQDTWLELASQRYTPSREVVLVLLDREPVRALFRELFLQELLAFGRKLRAPVVENPLAKGLGGLGRFARDRVRSSGGAFGTLATDVASAVSGEVERQLDRKAEEFADAALSRVLHRFADLICDPGRAGEYAAIREALAEGVLDLDAADLAHEWERSEPVVSAEITRRGLISWIEREEAEGEIRAVIEVLLAPDAEAPLREVLDRMGLLDDYMELAHELALRRLRGLVRSDAFGAWLEELLRIGAGK